MKTNKTGILSLIVTVSFLLLSGQTNAKNNETDCADLIKPKGKVSSVLCKKNDFLMGYSNADKSPRWISYNIDPRKKLSNFSKTFFKEDDEIPEQYRVRLQTYDSINDYDRGMLFPDFINNGEARLLSTTVPLLAEFNRNGYGKNGAWSVIRKLDERVLLSGARVSVLVGPLYLDGDNKANGLSIPSHIYKIMYDAKSKKSISFLIPHEKNKANKINSYITSVDCIEQLSGLTFKLDSTLKRKQLKDVKNGKALSIHSWSLMDGNSKKDKCSAI